MSPEVEPIAAALSWRSTMTDLVNGFVWEVLQKLPMEFMAETQKLIGISLDGSVG